MSIGSRVRKYRDIKLLSQSDLAIRADVSQSAISSLESDKSIPNSVMLHRIAKELGVDINDLLKDNHTNPSNSDRVVGVIHNQIAIHDFSPENMMKVIMSNQEKITTLIETQNSLMEMLLCAR